VLHPRLVLYIDVVERLCQAVGSQVLSLSKDEGFSFVTNGANEFRILDSVICLEEAMDEVMDWLTIAPELLHHRLDFGIEGPDVTLAVSNEFIQILEITADQGNRRGRADLAFLEDPE